MEPISGESLTYPYDEAAGRLGISQRTLKRLVAEGVIRHIRIGGRVLFREADLRAYLDGQARGGAPAPRKGAGK